MEALGIDPKLLIAQIVNFAIFFIIFKKFIAKPLTTYLKKQQDEEAKRLALSQELGIAKTKLDNDRAQMLVQTRKEQKEILDQAKLFSENIKKDMLAQAQKTSNEIIESGKMAIQQEKVVAQKELVKYVSEVAEIAIKKGLATYLDDATRKSITEHVIKSM